jgi:alpha-tubulin suppressor-like RCC1 family protein
VVRIASATEVVTGNRHICAHVAGNVFCWGEGANGQLGDGRTSYSTSPLQVQNLTGATALAAGDEHVCAIAAGGIVSCWGGNTDGQLGDTSNYLRILPAPVAGSLVADAIGR